MFIELLQQCTVISEWVCSSRELPEWGGQGKGCLEAWRRQGECLKNMQVQYMYITKMINWNKKENYKLTWDSLKLLPIMMPSCHCLHEEVKRSESRNENSKARLQFPIQYSAAGGSGLLGERTALHGWQGPPWHTALNMSKNYWVGQTIWGSVCFH